MILKNDKEQIITIKNFVQKNKDALLNQTLNWNSPDSEVFIAELFGFAQSVANKYYRYIKDDFDDVVITMVEQTIQKMQTEKLETSFFENPFPYLDAVSMDNCAKFVSAKYIKQHDPNKTISLDVLDKDGLSLLEKTLSGETTVLEKLISDGKNANLMKYFNYKFPADSCISLHIHGNTNLKEISNITGIPEKKVSEQITKEFNDIKFDLLNAGITSVNQFDNPALYGKLMKNAMIKDNLPSYNVSEHGTLSNYINKYRREIFALYYDQNININDLSKHLNIPNTNIKRQINIQKENWAMNLWFNDKLLSKDFWLIDFALSGLRNSQLVFDENMEELMKYKSFVQDNELLKDKYINKMSTVELVKKHNVKGKNLNQEIAKICINARQKEAKCQENISKEK